MNKVFEKSIEVPNSGGARKSRLVPNGKDTICYTHDDVRTHWDILQRGRSISGGSRCLGWRDDKGTYSWITYDEFVNRAANLGSGLVSIGMKPGQESKVGIYSKNCVEFLVAQFACLSQSAIVVPLYDTLGSDASAFIINQAEIEVVFCDTLEKIRNLLHKKQSIPTVKHIFTSASLSKELEAIAKEKNVCLYALGYLEKLGQIKAVPKSLPKPDDTCFICYTSGTTGDPKGVVLTHKNITSATCTAAMQMGNSVLTKTDTLISYLPLAHMFEQIAEALIFLAGGSIGFFNGDINKLVDDIKVLQPTFFPAVPRLLNKLYDKAQQLLISQHIPVKNLSNGESKEITKETLEKKRFLLKKFKEGLGSKLRLVVSAAAPINITVLEFFDKDLGIEVMEGYGQTENGGPCTVNVVNENSHGNVGSPIACCIMKVVDVPDMEYYARDKKGEVCIKGHNVFSGYFKNPQATAEAIDSEGWLHTGDIGMWTEDGCLKIIDRKKHILKLSQGEYISPEKIENTYSLSPYINQVMVHGDSLKDFLVGIVVPEETIITSLFKEKLGSKTWIDICKSKIVNEFMLEEMRRLGKECELNSLEQVKAIYLHPEMCTYEKGFLTPTSKVKRTVWKKYFQKELHSLYDSYTNEKNGRIISK